MRSSLSRLEQPFAHRSRSACAIYIAFAQRGVGLDAGGDVARDAQNRFLFLNSMTER
jgi:hypothetical protein